MSTLQITILLLGVFCSVYVLLILRRNKHSVCVGKDMRDRELCIGDSVQHIGSSLPELRASVGVILTKRVAEDTVYITVEETYGFVSEIWNWSIDEVILKKKRSLLFRY